MSNKPKIVASAAISQLGSPYVFGTWGAECTPKMRREYAGYNPDYKDRIYKTCLVLSGQAAGCDTCDWCGTLAFDCRGFTHWCLMQAGIKINGGGATSQYNTKSNWKERGEVARMPDVVCCVFRDRDGTKEHTGLHIGGGTVIHCSGTVKEGKVTDNWTHYAVPVGLYDDEELSESPLVELPPRLLKKGTSGADVEDLQNDLHILGYDCGAVDGKFGDKTLAAVRVFQADAGLTVDGIVGPATRAAMENWPADRAQLVTVVIPDIPRATAQRIMEEHAHAFIDE